MSIAPGVRFGPYEVVSALGAGGMGEVYRARDTTLGRDVALKILPDAVAHDADRVARFRREAQILAALNHPLIASIYGVEDSGAAPVLVLELVEGPTLAERIARGALPLDEALPIAHQIAQALEAAHELEIVHRDLKPANIKVRPDGAVKVLDFGLAKALDPDSTAPGAAVAATVSSPMMTGRGVVLGTPAYMSPEQARGLAVDRGADIWAFGAVLFEMLTGARAFEGDDPAQTSASILRSDPDWPRLPPETPESIRRALRRCLEKDRRRRLGDIRDARLDIEDATSGGSGPRLEAAGGIGRGERLLWIAALAAVVIAGAGWWTLRTADPPAPLPERRVEIVTPPTPDPVSIALSPDGEKLAYVAIQDGRTQLWMRALGSASAQPLRDTDGAAFPFWSPDSQSIGFFAGEKLRRVSLDGSAPRILGPAVIGPGGTWSRDGTILFPMVPDSPLYRISEDGSEFALLPADTVTGAAPRGPGGVRYPQFLPDGRHFLYFVAELRAVFLGAIDGPDRRKLFDADAAAVVAPPTDVLFVRDGNLYAQRFDFTRLQVEGAPVSLASAVAVHPFGGAAVSASAEGSIAYRTGSGAPSRQFVWFDRSGARLGVVGPPDPAGPANMSLSPDGRRVAYSRTVEGNTDLWIIDVDRGVPTRFTSEPMPEISPVWQPDGRAILFSKINPASGFGLYVKPAATDGEATALPGLTVTTAIAMDYTRDGRYVLYRTTGPNIQNSQWDVWAIPTTGDRTPIAVAPSSFDERAAQFSPDTKWIAYESNEPGQYEIYVRPFPGPGASTRVSTTGGSQPRWRPDGRELFYVTPDSRLMSVGVRLPASGSAIAVDPAVPLFSVPMTSTVQGGLTFDYAVSPDGQRFLVNARVEQSAAPISLILNRKPLPR